MAPAARAIPIGSPDNADCAATGVASVRRITAVKTEKQSHRPYIDSEYDGRAG
jgi:hypothetical protein